ncbi:MAG: mechanosensitive ion channel [Xanthomonadales bacterium]|nr:mechanosensitive ion channel [Xanthomonadales bacterium]
MRNAPGRILLVLGLIITAPAGAQDTGSMVAAVSTAPEAIAASAIPFRGDDDERFAQDVIERASEGDQSVELVPRLDALEAAVRKQGKSLSARQAQKLPVIRLESLARQWRFYDRQYAAWRIQLKHVTESISNDAEQLGKRRANWLLTRESAENNDLAPALRKQIDDVLARIATAEKAISEPLDAQIALNRRANSLAALIHKNQDVVEAAITQTDSRLMLLDSPPIWNASAGSDDNGAVDSLKAGMTVESEFLAEYSAANAGTSRLIQGFALVLLVALVFLSLRSRRIIADADGVSIDGADAALRVLRRPFSSWLLLVMMSVLVLEPDAPILRHQLALFIALVPVLRLLPPAVFRLLGPWPYIVAALYLFNLFSVLLLANATYYRLYVLLVDLFGIGLIVWRLLKTRREDSETANIIRRIVRDAGWIACAILAVAAVANVAGNVSLAVMLTDALLFSTYVGLAIFAAANVVESLLRLWMSRSTTSRFRLIADNAEQVFRFVSRLIRLAALLGWLTILLNEFRILRPAYHGVMAMLGHSLSIGEISISLGNVVTFILSVLLAIWLARTTRHILRDEIFRSVPVSRGIASSVSSLSYYAILLLGVLIALAAAGFKVGQLTIILGALGVGIGLGLQNVVNNFVSGLILMFERPLQPGDVVEIDGTTGRVREIGMRSTALKTFDGADVVVPNGNLLSEKLVNWTLQDLNRRIDIDIGVAYGTDPERMLALMMEVIRATPGITDEPEPAVLFSGFGASSLDFSIRAWTTNFSEWVKIRSDMNLRLHRALTDAGIEIPFPQQDLHLRTISTEANATLLAGNSLSRRNRSTAPDADTGDSSDS